ncbi:DUF1326 domain-containing protein [Oleomonas cavernae]|uniref:DUF1326 domain-containing protein n=1 Tax=Oleomonas cavernae TaxID=2320859 RepID=A0A418WCT9_9PROT|nr:DUF1326 domain-containing protein [Oleomonas cavernae]RJF87851.1 DUF1326 domain-containing protein [Oleomonas cavernae]
MPGIDWLIRGTQISVCNCDWGCPCQFNALPTKGHCRGAACYQIDEGHFGDVSLADTRFAVIFAWPGPIHLGKGTGQLIIDRRADARQREALMKIAAGEETEPFATIFNVMTAMTETFLEPVFADVTFESDPEACIGRFSVPGLIEVKAEPIRNPVTGATHRARVVMADSFEFAQAEFASSAVKAFGTIKHDWDVGHAHFAPVNMTGQGLVR